MRMQAFKAKTGEPYEFVFGPGHEVVLETLDALGEASDSDLTFITETHMIAPRRCELRDAGLVERAGRKASGMTWRLSQAGRSVLLGGPR